MNARSIAVLLSAAHRARAQIQSAGELPDAAQAYATQDLVWQQIRPGARVRAWKVGGANDRVEPAASPILRLEQSPAQLAGADFHLIGLEAEIAFRLTEDLPSAAQADIAAAIGEAVVAIEICDTRLSDWKTASELWKLADFQNNAALVTGSGTARWQTIDWRAQRAQLTVNGATCIDVTGAHPFGNPFRLMPWIAAHCARRTGGLRAGDIVTTGSWGGVYYVEPGCQVHARFPGIGEASVLIRPR
ncbi:MAG: 2-keto-4-pentenoate hydratase [Betaproteobacteria bacterium]|nr:MAG: 2-keto-4-pentenoate hydratase [Betaproteobacteria bacterium]